MSEDNEDWKRKYEEASRRLVELQKIHWALRDELMDIKYHLKKLNEKHPNG